MAASEAFMVFVWGYDEDETLSEGRWLRVDWRGHDIEQAIRLSCQQFQMRFSGPGAPDWTRRCRVWLGFGLEH